MTVNAIQLASASKPRTIGELKQYLAQLEAQWTEEDTQYLGDFDSQAIYVLTEKGVAHGFIQYVGEFGLTAFADK